MKEKSEYSFTAEQFNQLAEEERGTVLAVAEYLAGRTVDISDEDLSTALNLMKTAMEMAEAELQKKGLNERQHFNFCLVIEPSYEDTTHVAVVDYDKPICYLHEWSKAWDFQFANLAALAMAVLAAKTALVNKVTELNAKEVIVVLEEGRVREVVGLPPNTQVTVVDYDVEDEDDQYLAPSPIDGQKCKLTKF